MSITQNDLTELSQNIIKNHMVRYSNEQNYAFLNYENIPAVIKVLDKLVHNLES